VPPLEQQCEVVSHIEAVKTKSVELQRLQREVDAELASFVPALLAKAFRSEL